MIKLKFNSSNTPPIREQKSSQNKLLRKDNLLFKVNSHINNLFPSYEFREEMNY